MRRIKRVSFGETGNNTYTHLSSGPRFRLGEGENSLETIPSGELLVGLFTIIHHHMLSSDLPNFHCFFSLSILISFISEQTKGFFSFSLPGMKSFPFVGYEKANFSDSYIKRIENYCRQLSTRKLFNWRWDGNGKASVGNIVQSLDVLNTKYL